MVLRGIPLGPDFSLERSPSGAEDDDGDDDGDDISYPSVGA